MSARTPDIGEASETVPVPFQGEPLEIGFNPEFLRDGLEAVETGQLEGSLRTADEALEWVKKRYLSGEND